MRAIYEIQSKIKLKENDIYEYASVEAIIPAIIKDLWGLTFEISTINTWKNTVIFVIHYEEGDEQRVIETFCNIAHEFCLNYNVIAIEGII